MHLSRALSGRGPFVGALGSLLLRRHLSRCVRRLEDAADSSPMFEEPVRLPTNAPAAAPSAALLATMKADFLGPRSLCFCCYWPRWAKDLPRAEEEMLKLIIKRAEIETGMNILDLSPCSGVSDWISEKFPGCRVRWASASQVLSADPESPSQRERFDRILSIESPELQPPFASALAALSRLLAADGRLFIQLPCHRKITHTLPPEPESNQTSRAMPASNRLPRESAGLRVLDHWELSGEHYERTARAWLRQLERSRVSAARQSPGPDHELTRTKYRRWRLALLETAEMYGLYRGQEWWLSQYLLCHWRREGAEHLSGGVA